jgi:hypothetical protein
VLAALLAASGAAQALDPARQGISATPQDPAARTAELHRTGRYDLALDESRAIADRALRAEWEFQLFYDAGDLRGALEAALAGLREAPGHPRLLQNALVCALTLGHGELSLELARRWGNALEGADGDATAVAGAREAQRRLAADAADLVAREGRAAAAVRRARWTSLALLCGCAGLLAWLAFARGRT